MSNVADVTNGGAQNRSVSPPRAKSPVRWHVEKRDSSQGVAAQGADVKEVEVELGQPQASQRHRHPASSAQPAAPTQAEDRSLLQRQAQAVAPVQQVNQRASCADECEPMCFALCLCFGFLGFAVFWGLSEDPSFEKNKDTFAALAWTCVGMVGFAALLLLKTAIIQCRRS